MTNEQVKAVLGRLVGESSLAFVLLTLAEVCTERGERELDPEVRQEWAAAAAALADMSLALGIEI